MKKQKISLQLRKQKISSLTEKQVQGGNFTFTITVPIRTIQNTCISVQINCKSILIACDPIITVASVCCPTTQPPTYIC
ncbi:hypothetical protein H2O64_03660 [Kordia sp. YSTF-M3]|uniref:Uncharacterized protein n=1 Tax=Kordia aestuariivivens TaxID=2759037 RepID=A0ABR7Q5A6_9FLAO|nr:hypothetical protein [Kordia aestuariivivens]MBC8753751.1 hypothetical protein [Kordia aestuariivivens]